jgi:predicted component of type VI protein secretion system
MLQKEVETWQLSHQSSQAAQQETARLEGACRHLQGQIERLVDAYQQGAIEVDDLKARRQRLEASLEATRARAESLEAQHAEGARLERLGADIAAFAAAIRDGLGALDFAGRQRLVRLLIERVIVQGEDVTIEHAVPLSGRFTGLRPEDRRLLLPEVWRKAAGAGVPHPGQRHPAHSSPPAPARAAPTPGTCQGATAAGAVGVTHG